MTLSLRQRAIMEIAKADGQVMVDDLAGRFSVSPQTIRRDLQDLCEARHLQRIHGGAVFETGAVNVVYETRRAMASAAKEAIGRAMAARVENGASLFLAIGTTTEAVARALSGHRDLLVVTDNLNVATTLGPTGAAEVVVAGGSYRPGDGGVVGSATATFLRQFKLDLAVIGTSAIDPDGWLLDYDLREVEATRAMFANARRRVLVADATKFERAAPVRVAELAGLDTLVTDAPPPPGIARIAAEAEVEIAVAGDAPVTIATDPPPPGA